MTVPLPIETERLLLRAFSPGDVEEMSAIYGDDEVMRYVWFGTLDLGATTARLERHTREQLERGFATWAVVERESGRVVGDAGLDVWQPTGEPELGYTLARSSWGHGYATEAARACLDAAFAHLGAQRVVATVEEGNDRSLRVVDRLGMRRVDTVEIQGRVHGLFARERP